MFSVVGSTIKLFIFMLKLIDQVQIWCKKRDTVLPIAVGKEGNQGEGGLTHTSQPPQEIILVVTLFSKEP